MARTTPSTAAGALLMAALARTALSQSVSEIAIPTANASPYEIAAGADGSVWFTESRAGKIGRVLSSSAPGGSGFTVREYPIPTPAAAPHGIALGPDGAIWFTEFGAGKIGRIASSGEIV